jgi:hypothetical protein
MGRIGACQWQTTLLRETSVAGYTRVCVLVCCKVRRTPKPSRALLEDIDPTFRYEKLSSVFVTGSHTA